jgi:glutamate-5-semialdehyde dehydrogenase
MREQILKARQAFYKIMQLSALRRAEILEEWAHLIETHSNELLAANNQDLAMIAAGDVSVSAAAKQRMKLDASKLSFIVKGVRDLAHQPDLIRVAIERTALDKDLVLTQIRVPLGVVAVVFEARPDVIPQILSLVLKSGNVVLLKGGREARLTNLAFMKLAHELSSRCPDLPVEWSLYFETREEFQQLLSFHDLIDLVIPRGGNELVQHVMNSTRIPVLGHADGVCHIFVERTADLAIALKVIVDSKQQYPAACNAVETILVDEAIATQFLPFLDAAATKARITLRACAKSIALLPSAQEMTEENWHIEYGDERLAVRIVQDITRAIEHINSYGSHHTDAIIAQNANRQAEFESAVDSACVFVNASTRFSDGYRFGKGAEVGISTSKLHARGPVGVEGLLTTKYILEGQGQVVADYVGPDARPFTHLPLKA